MSKRGNGQIVLTRRHFAAGAFGLAAAHIIGPALADTALLATDLGIEPDLQADQSAKLQEALFLAEMRGLPLLLPAGLVHVENLQIPGTLRIIGTPGKTTLASSGDVPVAIISSRGDVVLDGIGFTSEAGTYSGEQGLLQIEGSEDITLRSCSFFGIAGDALGIEDSAVSVEDCTFEEIGDNAIFAMNSRGIFVSGCRIRACGNGGIRIWRSENGPDGSIISGNRISEIGWKGGGNGQNGNGVNVYFADEVIVSDNHFADCAFTAIRANSTNNTQIRGNTCINSGEAAIFSEFAFSGSVVSDNIIDGAATGISISNLDHQGHLATCADNIVRNIFPKSEVNPDTKPIGIFAEADIAITGNLVDNVPGVGIMAGWGPYLRNVLVSDNIVRNADIAIGASIAEGAGAVLISGNLMSDISNAPLAGFAWQDIVSSDLATDAARFPNVTIGTNAVTGAWIDPAAANP